jgi:hypothetical protein
MRSFGFTNAGTLRAIFPKHLHYDFLGVERSSDDVFFFLTEIIKKSGGQLADNFEPLPVNSMRFLKEHL